MHNYDQLPNESNKAYRIRLYKNKEQYGLTNRQIGELCNRAFGVNFDESAHRKSVRSYLQGYEDAKVECHIINTPEDIELLNEIKEAKRDLEKERKKLQTEKIEYNKWLREDARDEMIMENICNSIASLPSLKIPEYITPKTDDKSYCLVFGDEHVGAEFEIKDLFGNVINSYSPEIFEERMWRLLYKTVEIIKKEHISVLNVFNMGDFSDGVLRVSQLRKLRFGVVDGTVYFADFITNWLNELTKYVRVDFQMTDGNHTELRQLGQPKGTFVDDNMGKVIREFIKIRLKDNSNFTFSENPTGYIYADLAGNICWGIHGEVKNMESTLKDLSAIYGVPIRYLFAGHLHHSKTEEIGIGSEVINIPSVIGVDPYAMTLNKTSDPSGKLIVFSRNEGKICEYTLKLN